MELLFLGTGASDWHGTDERGEIRRWTSTLLDGELLIDLTKTVLDVIPNRNAVTDVFFTHSHGDHFDPEALCALAPCRVYTHESWAGCIRGEGLTVIPLRVNGPVRAAGFTPPTAGGFPPPKAGSSGRRRWTPRCSTRRSATDIRTTGRSFTTIPWI